MLRKLAFLARRFDVIEFAVDVDDLPARTPPPAGPGARRLARVVGGGGRGRGRPRGPARSYNS